MQTLQFTRTLTSIVLELKARELRDFIAPILNRSTNLVINQGSKDMFSELMFQSRVGYSNLERDSRSTALLNALQLDDIYQPSRLGKLMTIYSNAPNTGSITGNQDSYSQVQDFYALLRWLVVLQEACIEMLEADKLKGIPSDEDILELAILDYDGSGVEATRLAIILETISEIYSQLSRIYGVSETVVRVRFVDSGSDILVGIQAVKEVVDSLRLLFTELWEKIRYRDFDKFDKKVESLTKGLSFVAAVQEQVSKGVIDEETGNILKTRVVDEVVTLIGLGATAATAENADVPDQKKLLAEQRGIKLLGTGEKDKTN